MASARGQNERVIVQRTNAINILGAQMGVKLQEERSSAVA